MLKTNKTIAHLNRLCIKKHWREA